MESTTQNSKTKLYISYALQGIVCLMFLSGAIMNLSGSETAVKGATDMGYPESSVMFLGLILLISTLLYLWPKTTVIGAILLTGWLGGAVATHVIHHDPTYFYFIPVVFGVLVWLSIGLRSNNIRSLMPF